jgi:branched-chain amino acid transport system permease protein
VHGFINVLIGGIAFGFVLFLMAGGLSITLGLMRFANMAHAAFAMLGGYVTALLIAKAGWPFPLALAAAVAVTTFAGVFLERVLFRRMYGAPELDQVLLTTGLVFVSIAVATFLFGTQEMPIFLPDYLQGNVRIGSVDINIYRLFLIAVGLLLLLLIIAGIEHTTFGAKIRAAVFNRRMTESSGIDVDRLYMVAFAIGAGLAGLGGALSVPLLGLNPYFPLRFLTELLIVVSVGGLGSLAGTFVAALMFGVGDVVGKYLFPEAGAFIIYGMALGVLLWRPNGLLGRRA